jgi:hypothetical protein
VPPGRPHSRRFALLGGRRDDRRPQRVPAWRSTLLATFLQAFGVSVLNPLVWVETVLVLSALASTVTLPMLPWFGLGAACGSLEKFSLLSFAARGLASLFVRRSVRRGFDALAGMAMLAMTLVVAWPMLRVATVQAAPRPTFGKSQARADRTPSIGPAWRIAASCGQARSECADKAGAMPLQDYWIE